MSKRLNDLGAYADLKFDTEKIKARTNEILNANSEERMIFMKYKKTKIVVIAAVITVLCLATAFAAGNIIPYFNSEQAREVGEIDTLTKYNEEIGETVTRGDKTLTLDNLAIDDSYLYVFFTLTAPKDFEFDAICLIDGRRENNWAAWDHYMVDEYTGKGVIKISVAHTEVPDEFDFEMYALDGFEERYYTEYPKLTDEDRAKLLYVSTKAHKAKIEAQTLTKEVGAEIPALNSTLDKVIISPLGSQLVITQHELNRRFMADSFAILDENGEFIHMMPENSRIYNEGDTEEIRTVPIMLNGRIPKSLTIIPYGEKPEIIMVDGSDEHKAEDFPFELKIGDRGKVIVTDVRYYDAKLEIDYRLEGDTQGLQMLYPVNNEGWNEMHADDGVWWLNETVWHPSTESYTNVFEFVIGEADANGDVPSAGSLRSADILRERFKSVRISYQTNAPELDYDNAVKIDLK